jgi:hypothetical protein
MIMRLDRDTGASEIGRLQLTAATEDRPIAEIPSAQIAILNLVGKGDEYDGSYT